MPSNRRVTDRYGDSRRCQSRLNHWIRPRCEQSQFNQETSCCYLWRLIDSRCIDLGPLSAPVTGISVTSQTISTVMTTAKMYAVAVMGPLESRTPYTGDPKPKPRVFRWLRCEQLRQQSRRPGEATPPAALPSSRHARRSPTRRDGISGHRRSPTGPTMKAYRRAPALQKERPPIKQVKFCNASSGCVKFQIFLGVTGL